MPGRLFKTVTAAALVLGLGVTLAHAAADDAIKGRIDCMKSQGKMMGVMVPMFKGEAPFDAAAIAAAIEVRAGACAGWADFWGADTQKGETLETRAKPEIWTDPEGFKNAGMALGTAFAPVKAAADEAAFKAAFPALGKACQGCHEKFQKPKEQ